jgi:hypothetical protein
MQKTIIGALVGAVILFLWQFMSWAALDLHRVDMSYTEQQGPIMEALTAANLTEGTYMVPNHVDNPTPEQRAALQETMAGKPWAIVTYHESFENNMAMSMIRSFIINFLSAFLLVWLLGKMANLNFQTTIMASLAVGLIGYLTIDYLYFIYMGGNTFPVLVDTIVSWGAVGAWLGWWLNRGK